MTGARSARVQRADARPAPVPASGRGLFERVGEFLQRHRLTPDPAHYQFAYRVLSEPNGPLAAAVARLTDGGVRLTEADVESLGAAARAPTPRAPAGLLDETAAHEAAEAQRLASEAHAQVSAFVGIARAAQEEARGFGRDLAAQAAGIEQSASDGADGVVRLAAAMVARVREAENQLARATAEADTLRLELEEARVTARRDPLTGLPNRRALEEAFARADRGRPLHVAVCDVDRFKRINDEHGHAVGDRVLRAIGGSLSAALGHQLVARHGGEEFAMLIADASPADALALVEAGREAVAARRFRTRETDAPIAPVTLSAGVTAVAPGETLADALARADRHLYAAKAAGRDCCRAG